MKKYNIKKVVSQFDDKQSKIYMSTYNELGFEYGFGKGGYYSGHSHYYFCDIMFSKSKIITSSIENKLIEDKLVIVPPRTYMADVEINDFFFLKFSPNSGKIKVPDKTEEKLNLGVIKSTSATYNCTLSWFDMNQRESKITMRFDGKELLLTFGNELQMIID